jgi:Rad3-related DNA helicase
MAVKKPLLNKDLVNPKDFKIGQLKAEIEAFKKYDEKRKAYYKDALIRLGELESLIDEVDPEKKLRDKLKAQRKTIAQLQLVIESQKIEIPEDLNLVKALVEIDNLRKQLAKARKEITQHQKTISELIYKLNQTK